MRGSSLGRTISVAARRGWNRRCVAERPALQLSTNSHGHVHQRSLARSISCTPVRSGPEREDEPAANPSVDLASELRDSTGSIPENSADFINHAAELLIGAHTMLSIDGRLFGWGATLFATGVIARSISLPLVYYAQLQAIRASLATREIQRIQAYLRGGPGSLWQKYTTFRSLRSIALRSAGTSSLKMFPWYAVVHLPVFVTATMAIRRIAAAPPPEWATGGIPGLCPDLSAADPTGVLPVVNTAIFLWNAQARSSSIARMNATGEESDAGPVHRKADSGGAKPTMPEGVRWSKAGESTGGGRGDLMTTVIQGVSLLAFPYMQHLPVGYFMFWISSGLMTAAQRGALASDSIRRAIGLPSAAALAAARREAGPPVLQAAGGAVKVIREQLEYVQQQVLAQFTSRRVDDALCADVNRALDREMKKGNIRIDLKAVLRCDKGSGKKYVAVVRRGSEE